MNVLYIEQNQDKTIGGSYYSLLYLIERLNRSKYQPYVMFYEQHNLIETFRQTGCLVFIFTRPKIIKLKHSSTKTAFLPLKKAANFFIDYVFMTFKCLMFLKKYSIKLVHLNNGVLAGYDWLLAAKLAGIKCITHARGIGDIGKSNFLSLLLPRYFDGVICVSDAVNHALKMQIRRLPRIVTTIYNGIDPEIIKSQVSKSPDFIRQEFKIPIDQPLIGIVGNIKKWKGQEIVIRAVEALKNVREYHSLKCLIVGDVSKYDKQYFNHIQALVENRNLDNKIIFTGYRKDRLDIMNALDLLIHASIEPEPFSRVILEVMSLCKPIISTAIGGSVEQIDNGISGVLVSPGNPHLLAREIDKLLREKELSRAFVKASREKVEMFHISKHVKNVEELYSRIISDER